MRYIIRRLEKGRGTKVVAEMKASQRHVQRHVQRLWYRKTGDGARSRPGLCRSGCRPVGAICRGPGGSAADCTVAAGRAPPPRRGVSRNGGRRSCGRAWGRPAGMRRGCVPPLRDTPRSPAILARLSERPRGSPACRSAGLSPARWHDVLRGCPRGASGAACAWADAQSHAPARMVPGNGWRNYFPEYS